MNESLLVQDTKDLSKAPFTAPLPQTWPSSNLTFFRNPCYMISIRSERVIKTRHAVGADWFDAHVRVWPGVAGWTLPDVPAPYMTRGKMGCALSHIQLWSLCVMHRWPFMIVLEDDVRFVPATLQGQLDPIWRNLNRYTSAVDPTGKPIGRGVWDMFFFGYGPQTKRIRLSIGATILPDVMRLKSWAGLFGYMISLDGARKLLQMWPWTGRPASEIRMPIDLWLGVLIEQKKVLAVCSSGPLIEVDRHERSDTNGIK